MILPRGTEPCVWMSAGLLTYKLCDRGFDCDRCPLDVALRGTAPEVRMDPPGATGPWDFPTDRTYAAGHLWVGPSAEEGGARRVGLDAFAAGLLGACRRVRFAPVPAELAEGEPFCELELDVGRLALGMPQTGRIRACNEALGTDAGPLLGEPYGDGWLVEMSAEGEMAEPLSAPDVRERAEHDLRRFRRGAALRMLVDHELGPVLADGGRPLTDLRQMVGGAAYLELLRDLVH